MQLAEGLELWLGPLLPPPRLREDVPQRSSADRAIFLGAGFTKATSVSAPLFSDYSETIKAALSPLLAGLERLPALVAGADRWSVTELAEVLHNVAGRRAVAELFMSEPMGDVPALAPGGYRAWSSPVPARAEGTYRTLRQWQADVAQAHPLHLSALRPDAPPVLLGRMLAEGFFRQVLSTNWDSYVELGAWLVGLDVRNARDGEPPARDRRGLQAFETGRDVALYPRRLGDALLLKLHGGVEHVAHVLTKLAQGRLSIDEAEHHLRSAFLVSSTDLTHWRDAAQWVQDVVSDALRSHRVFMLGVSGADTVSFRAVRARVLEWERAALEWCREEQRETPRDMPMEPDPLPLMAFTRDPTLRLGCMLSVSQPRGLPRVQVIGGDGRHAMRCAYAWAMLQKLLHALDPEQSSHRRLSEELCTRLMHEADDSSSTPLLALLCDALGPNARWAAMAEGRPPFESLPLSTESRWWYAPWFGSAEGQEGHRPCYPQALRQIAACAAFLSRSRPKMNPETDPTGPGVAVISVDPWTGVVQLPDWLLPAWQLATTVPPDLLADSDLLLLPWPWRPEVGASSGGLHRSLKHSLHWHSGRCLDWLASPRLRLLPLGDPEDPLLRLPPPMRRNVGISEPQARRNSSRRGLLLAAGWSELCPPIDWLRLLSIDL